MKWLVVRLVPRPGAGQVRGGSGRVDFAVSPSFDGDQLRVRRS